MLFRSKVKSIEELALNTEAQKIIREEIKRINSSHHGFKRFEQVRDFRLLQESFQVGHELTNLYKIKRHVVEKKFYHVIDELFKNELTKNK